MTGLMKLIFAATLIVQVLPDLCSAGQSSDLPSAELEATTIGAGWTTIDLIDLVRSSKSDCVVVSSKLVQCTGRIQVSGLKDSFIRGDGVYVEFLNSAPGKGGVEFDNANGVVASNFQLGWLGGGARDPIVPGAQRIQSLGEVTSCANRQTGGALVLDLPLEGPQQLGTASIWDDNKGWPWYASGANVFEVYFPTGAVTTFSAGRSVCLPQLAPLVSHRVLLRHIISSNAAFLCWSCQNVTIQKVRIVSAPGMGFVFGGGGSNFALTNNVIEPKCWPNCPLAEPSTTADASHFSDIAGNILVQKNDFGWQGDDGLNVTGLLVPVTADLGSDAQHWLNVGASWRGRQSQMVVGSKVVVYDAGLSELGSADVLASNPSTGRLRLSWLPDTTSNLVVARVDGIPKNVVVRDNRFHDSRARGILMGGSNALVEGNTIERVTMEAILVDADTGPWYEGPGAQHVKIERNTLSNVNSHPNQALYPAAISVGVSIAPGYFGVVGSPIRDIVIEDNLFDQLLTNPSVPVFLGQGVIDEPVQMN